MLPGPRRSLAVTADQLVAALDEAGIRRGVVVSDAYYFSTLAEERAENDWTAQQVARFPDRLIAFCSVNPLADFALGEIERCASSGQFKGLKLHLGTSHVDPVGETQSPKEAWQTTRTLPLTDDELKEIAGNVAPYLR